MSKGKKTRTKSAAQKLALKETKERIKKMRRYSKALQKIDLRKNIGKKKQATILELWDEFQNLTVRPTRIYRPKNKAKLQQAQLDSDQVVTSRFFDVAFIPTFDKKAKVKFKSGEMIISSKFGDVRRVRFDPKAMAIDPDAEIQRIISRYPDHAQFIIKAGEHLYNGGLEKQFLIREIHKLMLAYSPGGDQFQKNGKDNHWKKWLNGLEVFTSKNQIDTEGYRLEYRDALNRNKAIKDSARRKQKRKYGKKL